MIILDELKKALSVLEPFNGAWCVCGGIAASIYGREGRFTNDIDIAIIDTPTMTAKEIASSVLIQIGYEAILGFVNDPRSLCKEQVLGLVAGRAAGGGAFVGVDFLLPVFPWVQDAVARAQIDPIDYGFSHVPTIQPEDLIIAKLFALRDAPERGVDLLDVRSIMEGVKSLDYTYLERKLACYNLTLPGTGR
jgi:hypothetical protein